MDLAKISNQNQLGSPMIIAVKGPSSNRKREVATSLAEFLHYPLINEDDVSLGLETSVSTSSTTSETELRWKNVSQITKTQLQLKLQLIINVSLSTHFDDLLTLATSERALFLIIECTSEGGSVLDYEAAHPPVLTVDISKPFVVQDFVPTIINAVTSLQKVAIQDHSSSKSPAKTAPLPERIFKQAHAHEFTFNMKPNTNLKKTLTCNSCEKPISGPNYQCIVCDDFVLHQSCAKTKPRTFDYINNHSPFYLSSHPAEYSFSQEHKCKLCDQYSSSCNNCLLQTHIKCGLLPTVVDYKDHSHPFSFVIMPFWFDYEYKCIACDKFGKLISYKCYSCYMDLHITCAIPKKEMTRAFGPWGGEGTEWDDGVHLGVKEMLIGHGNVIDFIQIEYDDGGDSTFTRRHGGGQSPEKMDTVKFDYPNEYLTSINGYTGSGVFTPNTIVRSLTLETNKTTYGPFGTAFGYKFSSSHIRGHKVVGFHGIDADSDYGDKVIGAIGAYLESV